MAQTHPVRLTPAEIRRQAIEYFGEFGLRMNLTVDSPGHLRFEKADGFVDLQTRADNPRQVRLTINDQNCVDEIRGFRRVLAHESRVGRAALPGEHHLPTDRKV